MVHSTQSQSRTIPYRKLIRIITFQSLLRYSMFRFLRPRSTDLSDQELLARFQQSGDSEWLGRLYSRYMELSYGLCLRYLKNDTLAEDAVLNIFESLLHKVPEHEIRNFRNWLYTFVRNHCLMQLRGSKSDMTVSLDSEFMQSEPFWHPLEEYSENGHLQYLEDCFTQLSPQQKSCVRLFYYEGKTYKEIAEMKCHEVGKIRSYIQNGRRKLRLCLENQQAKAKNLE